MGETFTIQYKGQCLIVEPVHQGNILFYRVNLGAGVRSLTQIENDTVIYWAWGNGEITEESQDIGRLIEMRES